MAALPCAEEFFRVQSDLPAAPLVSLNVGATSLGIAGVRALFLAVRNGSAPQLDTLEVSANDAAVADDAWDAELAHVREARPALDVAYKAADSGVGAGGAPPPNVQAAMDAARAAAAAGGGARVEAGG